MIMLNQITPGPEDIPALLQCFSAAMLAILFLQSGLDKVLNYSGNKEWLTAHFAKSPLKGTVPMLLPLITLFELASGALSAIGAIMVLTGGDLRFGLWGASLAGLSILQLFFGQRLAQDYEGAANLVPYFILSMAAIWAFSL